MPAYLIARVDVTDPTAYREYTQHTARVIGQFGGRFLARGGELVTLEGPQTASRVVLIEFPSLDKAKAFYHSPEYTRVKALRANCSTAQVIAIDGYPDAEWEKSLAASNKLSLAG